MERRNEMEIISWSPGITLEELEKSAILKAFQFYRGNKTATANSLGIAVRTLTNKLEGYKKDDMRHTSALQKAETEERDYELRARGMHPDQLRERFPDQYGGEIYPAEPLDSKGYDESIDDPEGSDLDDETFTGSDEDVREDSDDESWGEDEDVSGDESESWEVESADSDDDVEPAPKPAKKRTVSVPKRKKVQKVSPAKASRTSLSRGRKGVSSRA